MNPVEIEFGVGQGLCKAERHIAAISLECFILHVVSGEGWEGHDGHLRSYEAYLRPYETHLWPQKTETYHAISAITCVPTS
jgi:hypothetical protein